MHRRKNLDGSWSYRVQWHDEFGKRHIDTFYDRDEAEDFETKARRARRDRKLAHLSRGRDTLDQWVHGRWWPERVEGRLHPRTIKDYSKHYDLYVLPTFGHVQLRDISVSQVERWRSELERRINPHTVRQSLSLLQSALSYAERLDEIDQNPAHKVTRPEQTRRLAVNPLVPQEVEAVRASLLAKGKLEDATLVTLLCYSGLRPQEALALEWRHIRDRTILVEQKNLNGKIVPGQKAKRPPRTVTLLSSLREDLEVWQRSQPAAPLHGPRLVFPKRGAPWSDSAWSNWTSRNWRPALRDAGVTHRRPYDSRHAYASLRLWEGWSLVEVAAELGHSPQVCASTYAHVLAELKEAPRLTADQTVREARGRISGVATPQHAPRAETDGA